MLALDVNVVHDCYIVLFTVYSNVSNDCNDISEHSSLTFFNYPLTTHIPYTSWPILRGTAFKYHFSLAFKGEITTHV